MTTKTRHNPVEIFEAKTLLKNYKESSDYKPQTVKFYTDFIQRRLGFTFRDAVVRRWLKEFNMEIVPIRSVKNTSNSSKAPNSDTSQELKEMIKCLEAKIDLLRRDITNIQYIIQYDYDKVAEVENHE